MNKFQAQQSIKKQYNARITLSLLFIGSILLIYNGFLIAYGVGVFSKQEQPFGKPYDEWIGKYWQWVITMTEEQSDPPNGSCLINELNSMVMVLDPSVGGRHELECDISSKDGIMIASWSGFHDNNDKDPLPPNFPVEQLSKITKERVNLGAVTSEVKVDGKSVGKVDEITAMNNNILNYKINAMENFTEIYAKPFNITIPQDTFMADQDFGTWPSGAHGWFLFLKPLPLGVHKVSYNLSVQGLGEDNVATEITYTFHVR